MPADRFYASSIKNKMKREDVHRAMKKKKGQEKLKRRLALAEAERKDPEARQVSRIAFWLILRGPNVFVI
jgi:ribosome production factor 1